MYQVVKATMNGQVDNATTLTIQHLVNILLTLVRKTLLKKTLIKIFIILQFFYHTNNNLRTI